MSNHPDHFRPHMAVSTSDKYLDATVRMASPAKLRLMLIERAIGLAGILAEDWSQMKNLGSCEHSLTLLDFLNELLSGVGGGKTDSEKEVCTKVADLYVFLAQHLVRAEENSDVESIREIQTVLTAEAETWRAVVAQESGNLGNSPVAPQAASQPAGSSSGISFSA